MSPEYSRISSSSRLFFFGLLISSFVLGIVEAISDAYQESLLRPYRSFSDVAIFHYYVPSQVTRATWEFAAFMDYEKCIEREVHITLQPGSYPIINPENASFPDGMYVEEDGQFSLTTVTKHQPHDALVFHAFNPVPGNWFALAYISDWVREIRQEGISHKCKYSLGSIASWLQTNDVTLLIPSVPLPFTTSNDYSYFKFYIPEHIWSFQLIVRNCSFQSTADAAASEDCVHGLGIQARALPFPAASNATEDDAYVISQPQPEQLTYYYLIVTTSAAATYTVILQIEECVNLLSPSHSFSLENLAPSASTSRHSNQSVSEDWEAILLGSSDLHLAESDGFDKFKCFPVIPLARIKHAQDFTDTFLIQGKDWYTPWLIMNSKSPVIVKLELLPFLDIGGTLKFGLRLFNTSSNQNGEITVISACVNRGSPPQVADDRVLCKPHLRLNVSSESAQHQENKLYFAFPQPGLWFFSFEMLCYNKTAQGILNASSCSNQRSSVYLDVRVQPCVYDNHDCGAQGVCEKNHRGQFFFSYCRCLGGWRGWGCSDGTHAFSTGRLLMKTLFLTLSNLFFIPAIALAVKRKFYAEAVVYSFTMLFSTLYHACDEEAFSFCLMRFNVLQFCDFYSAILSFWVTLVAMADLPWKMSSVLHMGGALTIALGVEYERTGLWVFAVPLTIGIVVLKISWIYHCQQKKSCYPLQRWWLSHFLPGVMLVCVGLFLFTFIETENNYKYIHSVWHIIIALSIVFLLPVDADPPKEAPSAVASQESEFIDVNDYSLSTDFERLVSATS